VNFFQRQDEARRASRRLVVLFVLAVLAVVCAVDAVVFCFLSMGASDDGPMPLLQWIPANLGVVIGTSLVVVAIIGLASLYKTVVLSGGGGVVARSLGGVRISADSTDPAERRLLNVVEEMAIASGVPMPEVYLLEQESGINAFAAGHNPANAAIGVTRGALTQLNRSELQGVIAHEFSHILNGDMRLNVRLMGLLFGLLVIALVARTVLRLAPRGGNNRKGGGAAGAIVLAALAVLVIGYVGLFFGRLIQAAVSRRREALADASAVQFTRDPSGLRNALVKIGAASAGSRIVDPEVDEVAHMLFAPGMKRLFATHPPLLERLKAIDPHFDPAEIERVRAKLAAETARARTEAAGAHATARERLDDLITLPTAAVGSVAALVGNPTTAHMELARTIRESLPVTIAMAAHHVDSAKALLFALALDRDASTRERQLSFIEQQLSAEVVAAMASLQSAADGLSPEQRMPALMLIFPSLHQTTREERLRLMSCLNGMLQREGALSLHSYVLRRLAQVYLRDGMEPNPQSHSLTLDRVSADVQVLLSTLASHGHANDDDARRAYEAGMHRIYPRERPGFAKPRSWTALDAALVRLDRLAPVGKEQLVEAMLATVTHDSRLTLGEAELLRAVCASLHCPLPPLVAA
jgi:Zn-dependent protease with chaperone function